MSSKFLFEFVRETGVASVRFFCDLLGQVTHEMYESYWAGVSQEHLILSNFSCCIICMHSALLSDPKNEDLVCAMTSTLCHVYILFTNKDSASWSNDILDD